MQNMFIIMFPEHWNCYITDWSKHKSCLLSDMSFRQDIRPVNILIKNLKLACPVTSRPMKENSNPAILLDRTVTSLCKFRLQGRGLDRRALWVISASEHLKMQYQIKLQASLIGPFLLMKASGNRRVWSLVPDMSLVVLSRPYTFPG